jgi:hypothetical protein
MWIQKLSLSFQNPSARGTYMLRKPFVLVFFRLRVRALKKREAGKLRRWEKEGR